MTNRKSNAIINMAQALIWACLFVLPSAVWYLIMADLKSIGPVFNLTTSLLLPSFLVYSVNYFILIPQLLFDNRKRWFFILNIAIVLFFTAVPIIRDGFLPDVPQEVLDTFPNANFSMIAVGGVMVRAIFYTVMVALPTGLRYVMKRNDDRQQLEEERRRNAEAELNWLKNQLNPHFLFNTLNNISSLTQIDADKAQESIGQLSELLRYALYESNVKKVRLSDEAGFMTNYVHLMSLRCNEMTRVDMRFGSFDEGLMISPLLFISLIENAFKHGTSAHEDSFVRIDMRLEGDELVFSCENSIHERKSADHSGSGIGIENMTRRLELLYPDSYSYHQSVEGNVYSAIVRILNVSSSMQTDN